MHSHSDGPEAAQRVPALAQVPRHVPVRGSDYDLCKLPSQLTPPLLVHLSRPELTSDICTGFCLHHAAAGLPGLHSGTVPREAQTLDHLSGSADALLAVTQDKASHVHGLINNSTAGI